LRTKKEIKSDYHLGKTSARALAWTGQESKRYLFTYLGSLLSRMTSSEKRCSGAIDDGSLLMKLSGPMLALRWLMPSKSPSSFPLRRLPLLLRRDSACLSALPNVGFPDLVDEGRCWDGGVCGRSSEACDMSWDLLTAGGGACSLEP